MPSPNDYSINVPDPSQAFMQGLQNGASIQDLQFKQQQQQVALSQQQAQQKALQNFYAKPDKTADDYAQMTLLVPGMREQFKQAYDIKTEAQQRSTLQHVGEVGSAIATGNPDVAAKLIDDRVAALKNTGAPQTEIDAAQAMAGTVREHPELAYGLIQAKLNALGEPGGKILANIKAISTLPSDVQKAKADASTAVSDATIKGSQAAVAPVTTALSNQLKQSEIDANNYKANPFGVAAGPNGTGPVLHGDDFLATLPAGLASQVKALAEGRQAFPAGAAMRNPATMQLLAAVGQFDPNFDAVNYNARNKTRSSFTAGPDAGNITAINTAVGHLVSLKEAFDKLGNSSIPTYNTAANWAGDKTGNADIQANTTAVKVKATAVANEMAKVFRSSGMSEGEIKDWKNSIDTSAPPAKSSEYINSAIELMQSRLDALGEKYTQGMGTTKKGIELLSPHARAQLQKLQGIDPGSTDQSSPSASPTRSYMRWANPGQQ